jgi:malonyl-CoA O-methyltransferase
VNRVDKRKVAAAFSRQAHQYDAHAALQRAVVARLLARIEAVAPSPRSALDVGAGTGSVIEALLFRHPELVAAGVDLAHGMVRAARHRSGPRHVVGDAEALPFRSAAFDVVASASAYQWMEELGPAFAEARRVLVPGGWFACALFGGETLRELRDAWRSAQDGGDGRERIHAFFSREQVARALAEAGFPSASVVVERTVEHHSDLPALLRALKRIGAGNAAPGSGGGLADRRLLLRASDAYERLREPLGLPVTWDVVYVSAR